MAKSGKYSWKERLNLGELYDTFLGMAPKQQILAIGGVALLLVLLIILPVTCASSRLGRLEKQITDHEKNVSKVMDKLSEYQEVQAELKKVEGKIRPKPQIELTSRLEALANQSGVGNNMNSLNEKPGAMGEDFEEVVVAVKMTKLSLSQIIEFLYGIESQKDLSLKITRMKLKPRYDNRALFDVNFDVSTMASKPGG